MGEEQTVVRFFEEAEIGDEITPIEMVVTYAQVLQFCEIWLQGRKIRRSDFPRFTSDEAARKEGFAGAIVPGIMSMAFLSQLLMDWSCFATIKKLDVIFRQPVLQNRPLKLHGIVTDKSLDDGEGVLQADLYLDTETGERLVTGQATLTLLSKEVS